MNQTAHTDQKQDIKDLSRDELVEWLRRRDQKAYRAAQIFRWIYHHQADSFDVMTNLGKDVRERLGRHFSIARLEKVRVQESLDGSKKYLFRLRDGNHIESVLIPERDHFTLCVSSQVGCAMGCRFCLTARGGLERNLAGGEILAQIRDIRRELPDPARLTNVVFMGMGEPLANYNQLLRALRFITDAEVGLGLANRRVTVSTAGLIPGLTRLGRDTAVNLAVSLNAADNAARDELMPVNRRWPLESLLEACRLYPLRPHRKITFEYILIAGVNDGRQDARRLARLLTPIRAKVNLIPFNAHEGGAFRRPEEKVILAFQEILLKRRFTTVIRRSKGMDISAACGQLRARVNP